MKRWLKSWRAYCFSIQVYSLAACMITASNCLNQVLRCFVSFASSEQQYFAYSLRSVRSIAATPNYDNRAKYLLYRNKESMCKRMKSLNSQSSHHQPKYITLSFEIRTHSWVSLAFIACRAMFYGAACAAIWHNVYSKAAFEKHYLDMDRALLIIKSVLRWNLTQI